MNNTQNAAAPTPAVITEGQLVTGQVLLEILFAPRCRPTLRWLQTQRKAGRVPCFKIGQLVFFDPVAVRVAFAAPTAAAKPSE